jgi:hypothetical protein
LYLTDQSACRPGKERENQIAQVAQVDRHFSQKETAKYQ